MTHHWLSFSEHPVLLGFCSTSFGLFHTTYCPKDIFACPCAPRSFLFASHACVTGGITPTFKPKRVARRKISFDYENAQQTNMSAEERFEQTIS
jgi:hypothetical protein